jgi:predicted alpha-1,6-mannanase (GH76 family)
MTQEPQPTGDPAADDSGRPDYRAAARAGIAVLQRWYSRRTGLWKTTGWWNSANALTAVISYTRYTGDESYLGVIENTFTRARRRNAGFINEFFDDNLWWALAWVDARDLTGDARYLEAARAIFAHSLTGWDGTCGGGLWWNEQRRYKNAITNELFLALAARLARRARTTAASPGPTTRG